MIDFSFKNLLPRILVSCGAILLIGVTGCSSGGPSKELIASCEKMNSNLLEMSRVPDLYKVSAPSDTMSFSTDDGYFVTNIGNETRARNKQVIKQAFPFVSSYLDVADNYSGNLDNQIILTILKEAIKGTGFELSLTPAQQESIKGDYRDSSYQILKDEINRIVGDDYVEDDFVGPNGCKDVSNFKYENEDSDNPYDYEKDDTTVLWSRVLSAIEGGYEIVVISNVCERTGKYLGEKCAKKDYIYKPDYSDSTSTTAKVNPWARTWRSSDMERLAKTVWCIENGYRDYSTTTDDCIN